MTSHAPSRTRSWTRGRLGQAGVGLGVAAASVLVELSGRRHRRPDRLGRSRAGYGSCGVSPTWRPTR